MKKDLKPKFQVFFHGGDKRDRTADLLNAMQYSLIFSYFFQDCSPLETIGAVWFEDFNRYCSRLKTKAKKCELDGSIAYLLPTIFKSKLLFRLDLFSLSF